MTTPHLREIEARMARAVKTYAVTMPGFSEALYTARTPAGARMQCWGAYSSYDSSCSFKQFLSMHRLRRVENPPGIGERIMVSGLPATRVLGGRGHYVAFMRDDADTILFSHPADASPYAPPAAADGEGA